jgi:acyl transferase domain-containing protein
MQKAALAFETNLASHLASRVDQPHPMLPLYSTVTGTLQSDANALDASYWRESLVSPVLFSSAVRNLLKERNGHSTTVFMEIGCHPTLSGFLRQIQSVQALENPYVPTLRKSTDQVGCIFKAVGELFSYGCSIKFSTIHPGKIVTGLPNYPWDRKKLNWQESRLSRNWRFRKHHHHELLGSRMLEATNIEPSWRNLMGLSTVPWIKDHRVLGEIVFPCAGYIAMINEATRQQCNTQHCTIRNLHIKIPLILPESGLSVEIITTMRQMRINDRFDSNWHEFTISSYDGVDWTKHTVGQVLAGIEGLKMSTAVPKKFSRSVSSPFWYDQLSKLGLQYGPSFQGLQDITADPVSHTASAWIFGRFERSQHNDSLHPTAIDHCLQLFSVAACRGKAIHLRDLLIPIFIDEVYLKETQDLLKVEVTTSRLSGIQGQGNVALMSDDHLVLFMKGVRLARMPQSNKTEDRGIPLLSHCEWLLALDFLPSHLQLPETNIHKNTAELLVRVARFFMTQLHQNVCRTNVAPQAPRFKAWPEAPIDRSKNQAGLFVPNVQDYAYNKNGPRGEWLSLEQQLKAANLDFISQLYQQALAESPLTPEDEENPSYMRWKLDPYQKLQDWISSTHDLSGWFSLLRHCNPRLRILEIGAGKGFFSSNILQHLTCDGTTLCSLYMATDTLHVEDALKERLKGYENVEYKTLDLNHDLSAQGFDHSRYDLLIVSKVCPASI